MNKDVKRVSNWGKKIMIVGDQSKRPLWSKGWFKYKKKGIMKMVERKWNSLKIINDTMCSWMCKYNNEIDSAE